MIIAWEEEQGHEAKKQLIVCVPLGLMQIGKGHGGIGTSWICFHGKGEEDCVTYKGQAAKAKATAE